MCAVITKNKSPISLINYFIFEANTNPPENEESQKILYYHPQDTDINQKLKNVGLCEALVKFTQTFNPTQPCQSLHTQKTRQVFHEAEDGFWMVMTVSVPQAKSASKDNAYDYYEDDVQDNVMQSIMRHSYEVFRLFHGTFTSLISKWGNNSSLKLYLREFFGNYLPSLKLHRSDIFDVFRGMHFLPLDKHLFLRVQCLMNLVQTTWSEIKHTIFLYGDQLVWSGLNQEDTQIIYHYIVNNVLRPVKQDECDAADSFASACSGKYLIAPSYSLGSSDHGVVPQLLVNNTEEVYLVVYSAVGVTVCLLFDAVPNFELCHRLDHFLGPQLTELATEINEQCGWHKNQSFDTVPSFCFLYFNRLNLAQKCTTSRARVPPDVMKQVIDINQDLHMATEGEIIAKTTTDCWIVGKLSEQREFYVISNQKNVNLIEISEEVRRTCAAHLNNIFFHD